MTSRLRTVLDVSGSVGVVLLCIKLLFLSGSGAPPSPRPTAAAQPDAPTMPGALPTSPLNIAGAPTLGEASAPVTAVVFSDFECPFCGLFARQTLPKLKARYIDSGKLRLVFRQFPLQAKHQFARPAAEASVCAATAGRFWEAHELMFSDPKTLEVSVGRVAVEAGVDANRWEHCLKEIAPSAVDRDIAEAKRLKVSGTPTFFVGTTTNDGLVVITERLTGALPIARFVQAIDPLLRGR